MLRWILRFTGKHKILLFWTVLAAILASGLSVVAPAVLGRTVDLLAAKAVDFSRLGQYLLVLGLLYGVSALLSWLAPVLAGRIACSSVSDIRKMVFDRLSRLPIRYYDTHKHGDVISRLTNDAESIADGLHQSFVQLFGGIVTVVGTLIAMLLISPVIAFIVVCITPLSILIARFVIVRTAHLFSAQQQRLGELNARAEEMISARTCVRAYCMEESVSKAFCKTDGELYTVGQKAQFSSALINPSTRLVNHISYISVGVVGALFALSGFTGGGRTVTIGVIASLLTYATQFAKPINEIAGVTTQIQSALAAARRISEICEEEPEPEDAQLPSLEEACGHLTMQGAVSFENISFSYTREQPLIRNLNLSVKPGSIVAIVGRTGAGKTTLVNLLMRYYDPTDGMILVDEANILQVRKNSLRQAFSMVLQDTWLFTGTIRENIAYGRPDATEEEIVTAAKEAYAHSFIKRLPKGYDTVIRGDGSGLSQGQQQLLTIARAMLVHPPMLILDEATSSVDVLTEQSIQQAFNRLMVGRTSFIIAHRLATIRHADVILVMDYGDIVEQGSHEELLKRKGVYWTLVNQS